MRFLLIVLCFIGFLQAYDFNDSLGRFIMLPKNFQNAFLETTNQCFVNHPEIAYKLLEAFDNADITLKEFTLSIEDFVIMLITKCGKYNNRFFIELFKTIGGFENKQNAKNIMESFYASWYVVAKAMKVGGKL